MSYTADKYDKDRAQALLALASRNTTEAGEHPLAEDLAAVSANQLTPQERAQIMAHLIQCHGCRQELLAVESLLQNQQEERHSVADLLTAALYGDGQSPETEEELAERAGASLGAPISPQDLDMADPGLLGFMHTSTAQAEVMAQESEGKLFRCPWCGAVGLVSLEPSEMAILLCDRCGGAFAP